MITLAYRRRNKYQSRIKDLIGGMGNGCGGRGRGIYIFLKMKVDPYT